MIVKASMSDRIKCILLDRIVAGDYKPGDKLLEISLSEEFGIPQDSLSRHRY